MNYFACFVCGMAGYFTAVLIVHAANRLHSWWHRPRCEICGQPACVKWVAVSAGDGRIESRDIDLCELHLKEQVEMSMPIDED